MSHPIKKKLPGVVDSLSAQTAFVYARVSSREQAEGYSIDAQLKLLRDYAAAQKLVVAYEYVEVESASQTGRPLFNDMLKRLEQEHGKKPVILVEKVDRLYRNSADPAKIADSGTTVHFVKAGLNIGPDSTSGAILTHDVLAAISKFYSKNLAEESAKGMLAKARRGLWPSYAPIGYLNVVGTDGRRTVIPDPLYALMVRSIYEWYAQGGLSIGDVARRCTEAGYLSPKTGQPFSRATIHNILKSRLYTGTFDWEGERHSGGFEAIVPLELWEHVQSLRKTRGTCPEHPQKHWFAYSGLVRCGYCNCLLTGDIKRNRNIYYAAQGFAGPGKRPRARETDLDLGFADALTQLGFAKELMNRAYALAEEARAAKESVRAAQIARLKAECTKAKNRLEKTYVDYVDKQITEDQYAKRSAKFKADEARLAAAIQQLEASSAPTFCNEAQIHDVVRDIRAGFLKLSAQARRKVLNLLGATAIWKDGRLHVKFDAPFEALRLATTHSVAAA